ncbi:TonB-dependent receptor [Microbacter margulisiae]|uniref:Outer membrane receptor for ferrienterochelin and colicin n=1 Tax=Microbacter margulisiae TaxID=1350067 RepID=A0A7W5H366_9PORP|nr:TonB-dependent receptor [Microbacter margulisiae]MBB3188284.1 outer membrane receptor for ferrienterochelin and colicin [Microbacter margulisiae]
MRRNILFIILLFILPSGIIAQKNPRYTIQGQVIDKNTRAPISYASVIIWNSQIGTTADSIGRFKLSNIAPGSYRLQASFIGYANSITPEFLVINNKGFETIELEETAKALQEVEIKGVSGPFRRSAISPLSLKEIGFTEIEKSAGSNRDISRVLESFPGVASSTGGYRNDLIVRGGGPSENSYYIEGIAVPTINHFSTQGASGGPVGIFNAELISKADFYTGAFPADRGDALSSILNIDLKDGSATSYNYSGVVGSSDLGFNTDGHIGNKITYLFSARQSYLQYLFKALKLPFLPTYWDSQFKVKIRFNRYNQLTLLGLGGIDRMTLNTDTTGQTDGNKYIVATLPIISQNTYTVGGVYKHFAGNSTQSIVLSHDFFQNTNLKYLNNDAASGDKILNYNSYQAETRFRFENSTLLNAFRIDAGIHAELDHYFNHTGQTLYSNGNAYKLNYLTNLSLMRWGIFATGVYKSPNEKLTLAAGFRTDATNYASTMNHPFGQFSPRVSLSYQLLPKFYLNGNVGTYFELPPYTVLGYKNNENQYVNKGNGMKYLQCNQVVIGIEHQPKDYLRLSLEGFYKKYINGLYSLSDSIPLASEGADYNVYGTESVSSTATGRAYGVEASARWFGFDHLNFILAYTYVRSEYINPNTGKYIPSSWDNRNLLTVTSNYQFPRNWALGMKFRAIGGAPYTPYDYAKSSLKVAWDAKNSPYLDYALYNTKRLATFTELDLRVDKTYYFKNWMFGFYLDVQNALGTTYREAPVLYSTGLTDPTDPTHYLMKTVQPTSGTILPSIGIMVEF